MTIAVCYLSPEGVVLGADSTTTMFVADKQSGGMTRQFDFAQKVFQIGEMGNLGVTMWGCGSLGNVSYRTLIARFADEINATPCAGVDEVAMQFGDLFYREYLLEFSQPMTRAQSLASQAARSIDEEQELQFYEQNLSGGFCIGGYCLPDRQPRAFEILYGPLSNAAPVPTEQAISTSRFWGCPNLINRLLFGMDDGVFAAILSSPLWTGTPDELFALLNPHSLGQPRNLPIREAIDWVHASIYSTIKTMKFSHLAPVCGGPIEVAAITTDRPFRWVRHKEMNAAFSRETAKYV